MSSDANIIATRYVSALFELATEKKQHDNIKKDFLLLKAALSGSDKLQKFLVNPLVTKSVANKAILAILASVKSSELTQGFFTLLTNKRRLGLSALIIDKYLAKLAESRGELTVKVTSAQALSNDQAKLLSASIAKSTSKKIELDLHEDSTLIGGLQIRIGSKMLDNSISGKLSRLRLALAKAA